MSIRVLLIEDNAQNMYMMRFLLEKKGFTVIEASGGAEGLIKAGTENPDIILLDVQLPEMDGYAVAETLKKNQVLREIPIVAATSYAMAGDRERILKAGADGYIEKPINPETFAEEIMEYMPSRSSGGEGGMV